MKFLNLKDGRHINLAQITFILTDEQVTKVYLVGMTLPLEFPPETAKTLFAAIREHVITPAT